MAAEDLEAPPEGADSSVFTAVRRKGANAAPTAAGAAAASGEASAAAILGGDVVGFAGTGVPGGTGGSSAPELAAVGAAALASTDVDDRCVVGASGVSAWLLGAAVACWCSVA